MQQKQKQCAYCHAILFEDDDVVYCPECGAPHHRECYNRVGHCARQGFHNQPEQEQIKNDRPDGIPLDREGHTCERCGQISTSDTLFCPYCGTAFIKEGKPSEDSSNEDINGNTERELTNFVRSSPHYYIPRFKLLANGSRRVYWNWAAFLLGPIWLFFRKCYREGFIALLFSIIPVVLNAPFLISMNTYLYENGLENAQLTLELSEKLASVIPPIAWLLGFAATAVTMGIRVVLGLYGNSIYFNRVQKRIEQIKADDRFEDKASAIAMAGGCNIFSAIGAYYLTYLLTNLITTFFM